VQAGIRYSDAFFGFRLSDKAVMIIAEIGLGEISTATSFIDYFCSKYGMSKSGAWYCLKKLKKAGLVAFTEKGEQYTPLSLTEKGIELFRKFGSVTSRAVRPQILAVGAAAPSR
jgi:predicted transcriptional regulator